MMTSISANTAGKVLRIYHSMLYGLSGLSASVTLEWKETHCAYCFSYSFMRNGNRCHGEFLVSVHEIEVAKLSPEDIGNTFAERVLHAILNIAL